MSATHSLLLTCRGAHSRACNLAAHFHIRPRCASRQTSMSSHRASPVAAYAARVHCQTSLTVHDMTCQLTGTIPLSPAPPPLTRSYRPTPYSDPPKDALAERAHEVEPLLMALTRRLLFLVGTVGCKALLQVANTCRITKDEHYAAFLRAVEARGNGTPLITVSNHACPLDDPCMLAALMPFRLAALKPELMRFTICSQDICFNNGVLESFFGAAKVMPIARGEGIDQRLLQNMQRRLASGAWCHIFPEGSCFQTGSLSGRTGEGRQRLGRLKWGVGKLIAHAPCPPVVFPLFHTGMQGVTPLHPNSRKYFSLVSALTPLADGPVSWGSAAPAGADPHGTPRVNVVLFDENPHSQRHPTPCCRRGVICGAGNVRCMIPVSFAQRDSLAVTTSRCSIAPRCEARTLQLLS
ncbi:hypothetical protein JKP88DRAFT_266791 [Tribonema minus]|uniref:Tafazzin family protein n=1 Tax=Tribonema minus TaxID=303371 RepID=A0A835ZCU4_9STRA|nr:hypothetical protein JKP88DRAFT_266791 [Tribonema minus]